MTLSTYLLYLAAVTLLIVTPGPTLLMCMTNAINHGTARAMASVTGALTASTLAMALSALGLGAVLAASEAAFTTLKVIGAAYLIWLGVRTFRSGGGFRLEGDAPARRHSLYVQGLLVGASNPKALIFFAAFFPQFIDPARPLAPQFALLAGTFVVGDFLMMLACAIGVGRLAPRLKDARAVRWINRICGGLFALLGGLLLLSRRHA
ncbi:MAG TPA: LysE family transporter [Ramlibacter sp.]|uniref:LysE family translocator n=1 Tax=Ramlibacter sp. TaxID=1917967 RepID=UPI002C657C5F|nr:LysE family transporter [Ramlibacter sp.]HVZ43752.1 LysE family transporter [Ramlibacter sp.]